jgi:ribonuclease G
MSHELVISSNPIETTVAILEDDRLVEICVEHHAKKAIAGSIYKGRVTRVLPGMQSAFVDLGLKRDAFLYVTDVLDPAESIGDNSDSDLIEAEPPKPLPPTVRRSKAKRLAGKESSDSVHRAKPRRHRQRRRRRRRSQRPGAGAAAAVEAEPKVQPKEASPERQSERTAEGRPVLLPGESIAKYRKAARKNAPDRKSEKASGARSGKTAGRLGETRSMTAPAPAGETNANSRAAMASTPQTGSEPSPRAERESPLTGAEPPRGSAKVSAPPAVAELRLGVLSWLKRKAGTAEDTAPVSKQKPPTIPSKASPPAKGSAKAGRARKGASRPVPRSSAGARKRRSGRRPSVSKRSRGGRAKAIAKRAASKRGKRHPGTKQHAPQAKIKDLLKSGQELIVQVSKEPVGAKGAHITSHVTLPGRYMVYMTTAKHNGVARKIQPESERNRLRKLVKKHSSAKTGGFVVRTAGRGVAEEKLAADMEFLYGLWTSIREKSEKRKAPAKLHSDLDIVERVLRDHLGQDCRAIWVDSEGAYARIVKFVERFQPDQVKRVKLYRRRQPIHDSFGISKDLNKALKPKVWLKSGAYLVINQTEALVAIDVNTGRYVGKSDRLEDTVLKTNLEAAEEIVRQLRLRDLGGIIVIDFIDMEDRKNRQNVQQVLQDALRKTRSPSRLLPFNDFGLVVITRKAARQSLERALCMPCPACSGAGRVKSSATVLSEIFSAAGRIAAGDNSKRRKPAKELTLRVHPQIAKSLRHKSNSHLDDLEELAGTGVLVRGDSSMHPEHFTLT